MVKKRRKTDNNAKNNTHQNFTTQEKEQIHVKRKKKN